MPMPTSELRAFLAHLRLKFQLLIAPAAFLFGVVFSSVHNVGNVILQFFNIHILLLGGATAFNSYYDRDEGPVEGLSDPPPMARWMLYAACILQALGLILLANGLAFRLLYLASILGFSFGYSHPAIRWKGRPIFSLLVVGLFGGVTPFLMGFLAAGGGDLGMPVVLAMIGIALVVVSMFPITQAHQIAEDRKRGDATFSAHYGITAIRRLFLYGYGIGIALIAAGFLFAKASLAPVFLAAGILSGLAMWSRVQRLNGTRQDYDSIMRLKLASALSLNLFLVTVIIARLAGWMNL